MLRAAFFAIVLTLVSAANGDGPTASEKVVFHDPFYAKLAADWTWVREAPGYAAFAVAGSAMGKSWKVFKNGLVVRVLPGYLHASYNNSSNILLRPLPDTGAQPFAIEVALRSNPKVPYEHAGLLWYVNDDNYVALFREFLGTRPQVIMVTEKKAHPTFHYGGVYEDDTIYLRLEIAHGKITGKFRGDPEEDWETIGTSTLPLPSKSSKVRVGLQTGGAPELAGRFVRFWDLRILALSKPKAKAEKTTDGKKKTKEKPE